MQPVIYKALLLITIVIIITIIIIVAVKDAFVLDLEPGIGRAAAGHTGSHISVRAKCCFFFLFYLILSPRILDNEAEKENLCGKIRSWLAWDPPQLLRIYSSSVACNSHRFHRLRQNILCYLPLFASRLDRLINLSYLLSLPHIFIHQRHSFSSPRSERQA